MDRNLDGVYFRIERNGKYKDVCFSDLTDEEAYSALEKYDREAILRLAIILKNTLKELGEMLDLEM